MLTRPVPYNPKFYDALDASLENFSNNELINPYKFFANRFGYPGNDKEKNIYRKLNQFEPNHRLYADELVLMCEELGVYSAPVASFFMGFASVGLENNRLTLSQSASAYSKVFGNFNSQLIEAMSDGVINDNERKALVSLLDDSMAKLQRMRAALTPPLKEEPQK